jgi:putative transposase
MRLQTQGGDKVARQKSTPLRQEFNRLIPKKWLQSLAQDTGAVKRQRKVDIYDFFWTLVLGFGGTKERTLAGLRRTFEKVTGIAIEESSFYDRFTHGLAKLMKVVLGAVLAEAGTLDPLPQGTLSAFKDVLMTDSTVIRLHDLLKAKWPACRTNHTQAALKAHVILSVQGCGPSSVRVTSERVHDGPVLRAGKWVKDRLLLFDLGYYQFRLFARIVTCGGYFLTRLKENANPVISAVHRGSGKELLGKKLQDVLGHLKRKTLDVEVELTFHRKAYWPDRARKDKIRCRLVGLKNAETGRYHLYVTNVPVETLAAEEVGQVYSARWLIELAFRELKSQYAMESMPSSKSHIVEALLYAAFLTMVVSRRWLRMLRLKMGKLSERCRTEQWATIFRMVAADLLAILLRPCQEAEGIARRLMPMIREEIVDPNASRAHLLTRAGGLKPA